MRRYSRQTRGHGVGFQIWIVKVLMWHDRETPHGLRMMTWATLAMSFVCTVLRTHWKQNIREGELDWIVLRSLRPGRLSNENGSDQRGTIHRDDCLRPVDGREKACWQISCLEVFATTWWHLSLSEKLRSWLSTFDWWVWCRPLGSGFIKTWNVHVYKNVECYTTERHRMSRIYKNVEWSRLLVESL